ncbi:MAG: hypothetical protein ACOH5I_22250 [Oligoflexus sp.]
MIVISNAGIHNPAGGGYYMVQPEKGGFILFSRSLIGMHVSSHICSQYALTFYRVADSKLLAYRTNNRLCPSSEQSIEPKPFDKYEEEEKALIKASFFKHIDQTLEEHSKSLLKPKAPVKSR